MVNGVPDARTITIWIQPHMTGDIIAIIVQLPVLPVMDMRIVPDVIPVAMEIYVNLLVLAAKMIFAIKIRDHALMGALMATTRKLMIHVASAHLGVLSVLAPVHVLHAKMQITGD